jgi:hypothetical protein
MKAQPKSLHTQLNLPLLEPTPVVLPAGQDQQLIPALIELLRSAVSVPQVLKGESHEPQTNR